MTISAYAFQIIPCQEFATFFNRLNVVDKIHWSHPALLLAFLTKRIYRLLHDLEFVPPAVVAALTKVRAIIGSISPLAPGLMP